ncbi:MAG: ATP-dependent RNA helicase DbpA [Mariprofundaceae bacterium]|nr:ATP-dependent RNA helicase DbpA [Mariprofundaceae bacterium]
MNPNSFSSLSLNTDLLKNLESLGYEQMTPIQAQSLPPILAGKDVIGQAKTGTGKTAAFGLGLLQQLDLRTSRVQALVLCPTRELADQVGKELRKLARTTANVKVLTLCGGMAFRPQISSLSHGAHIVVGTPGRLLDHLKRGTLKIDRLRTLVLDEADRMLDMGFQKEMDAIITATPKPHQTLLFSATFPNQVKKMGTRVMRNPMMVQVATIHDDTVIEQHFYNVTEKARLDALHLLLLQYQVESTVIFCNTKRDTQDIAQALNRQGFSAQALNGDLEQRQRDQTLLLFANKSISILVATDVAARGLDIESLDSVIVYQLSNNPEVHVHRIGRTGRAGSKGVACSLFTEKDELRLTMIADYLGLTITHESLPSTDLLNKTIPKAAMTTLQIGGGKKQKIRPGDILGALTGENGIAGTQVGKINVSDNWSYVAVNRDVVKTAIKKLEKGKLKGLSFRIRLLEMGV